MTDVDRRADPVQVTSEMSDCLKNAAGGLLIIALGLTAGLVGRNYDFGTLARIGPGFFPLLLAVLLVLLGSALLLQGLSGQLRPIPVLSLGSVKPLLLVIGAILAFALLLDTAGVVVSGIVLVMLSQLASETATFRKAVSLALFLPLGAALLFVFGLGVPLRVVPF